MTKEINHKENPKDNIGLILRYITFISLALTLLTPLIFSGSLFFPFITGKALFMRLCILIATTSYAVLAFHDRRFLPRKSPILYSIIGFLFILLLAAYNGVNINRSLWSNFERMEGFVTIAYVSIMSIIAAASLKRKEWTWLMNISLVISIVVGLMALGSGETRISGSLGNSSYLGVYSLIHIFLSLLGAMTIFIKEKIHKTGMEFYNILTYLIIFIFNTYILYRTGTRGAFVGLIIGLLFTCIILAIKEKNKTLKYMAGGVLFAMLITIVTLGHIKNMNFVKNDQILSRYAELVKFDVISLFKQQGGARVKLWTMAYEGVKERPILGYGQDNFGHVFAAKYDPGMYSQEQWFDRSHNVFMDWLIAAGVLGLLGYLLLFGFAITLIFKKRSNMSGVEMAVLFGLLISYFIHNIFVFDNLSSYVLFFLLLAYISDRYTHDNTGHIQSTEHDIVKNLTKTRNTSEDEEGLLFGFAIIIIFIFICIGYFTIGKPYSQNKLLINSLRYAEEQKRVSTDIMSKMKKTPADIVIENFEKVFELGETGKTEGYEQLIQVGLNLLTANNVKQDTKSKILDLISKRINYHDINNSNDPRYYFFSANYFKATGQKELALIHAEKAYNLSKEKQSFANQYALSLLDVKNLDKAILILEKAYNDYTENQSAYNYYMLMMLEKLLKDNIDNPNLIEKIAKAGIDGYKNNNHDLIFKNEFWQALKLNNKFKNDLYNIIIKNYPEKENLLKEIMK